MFETNDILSQSEVDALISFLKNQSTNDFQSETVLDQKSIDKLIELIGKTSNLAAGAKTVVVTDAETGAEVALDGAVISMEKDGNGFILIFVVKDGKKYSVAPETLVERKYVAVGSPWGLAISGLRQFPTGSRSYSGF